MPQENLDVFLSSDQQEFEKERNELSQIISTVPFLDCVPLENMGADSSDVLEVSLKAVRNSDIYVGVFGREYSEITIEEYKEAVKYRKPCLTYVKKVRRRNEKLTEFIEEELKSRFKYHPFKEKNDLCEQVANDLKRFIFETLQDGLKVRKQKKKEAQRLIIEERQKAPIRPTIREPLAEADIAFMQGDYLGCLVRTTIALELGLKEALRMENVDAEKQSLGILIQLARKFEVINEIEVNQLSKASYIRNTALHRGDIPNRQTIAVILKNSKQILKRLNLSYKRG